MRVTVWRCALKARGGVCECEFVCECAHLWPKQECVFKGLRSWREEGEYVRVSVWEDASEGVGVS